MYQVQSPLEKTMSIELTATAKLARNPNLARNILTSKGITALPKRAFTTGFSAIHIPAGLPSKGSVTPKARITSTARLTAGSQIASASHGPQQLKDRVVQSRIHHERDRFITSIPQDLTQSWSPENRLARCASGRPDGAFSASKWCGRWRAAVA